MERRGFIAALLGLPFMKWLKPKERPAKVDVYFTKTVEVRFDEFGYPPKAIDGEPIFCRFTDPSTNILYEVDGVSKSDIPQGTWIKFEEAMRRWKSNG